MHRIVLHLTTEERRELEQIRDRHRAPYMRERASALLQIADGRSALSVARDGLLKRRDPDSVYDWVHRYQVMGCDGLVQLPRRSRSFPPEFVEQLKDRLHQTPENFGIERTRWTLALIKQEVPELAVGTLQGVWSILQRLGIRYKRGRSYVHSPDPEYEQKKRRIDKAVALARKYPGRAIALYSDEMTYRRCPSVADCWHEAGKSRPLARECAGWNYKSRLLAALDAVTGKVLRRRGPKMGVVELKRFMRQIRKAYPGARVIFLIWDNWPMHYHDAVLEAAAQYRITILPLPTYSPWLNPVEKLWRKLCQEVLHMHRLADDWDALKERVSLFFEPFREGSAELLAYVGLLPT